VITSSFRHGTRNGYVNHWCRCDRCRAAECERFAAWSARVRAQPIPPSVEHGKPTTYSNYRCHCEPCREAWRAYGREYRARKKARTP
jgi:hypothetical protein